MNCESPFINNKLNVAVLMGGVGREREVSLQSGKCVAEALEQADLAVERIDISPENVSILDNVGADVFFIALHGRFGEDGDLQQILEEKKLIYTGCGPEASRTAFDKFLSKQCFQKAGIKSPAWLEVTNNTDAEKLNQELCRMGDKFVVKPSRQGSSVGVSVVEKTDEVLPAAQKCLAEFGDCMIEQFISGREITVGVLNGNTLPIIEIRTENGFYDYQSKYIDEQTDYLFDTVTNAEMIERINRSAMNCFNALGCRDFARIDFIIDKDNTPFVLEANTIPGFTTHSLLPKAAGRAGISMSELCADILKTALKRQG